MITKEKEHIETANKKIDSICTNESTLAHVWWHDFKYLFAGMFLGIIFIKGELISWFRIQEMFRLESFYMYGVIGTAVMVGMLSIFLIKKFNIKTIYGEKVKIADKEFNKGQIFGGLLFGFGWAMTGACPGPIYAQIGNGIWAASVVLLSAIVGTWTYGYFRNKLPH
jgi:uncharacterized membrane protein YedE/YeeE